MLLPRTYTDAVVAAGGLPVLLPPRVESAAVGRPARRGGARGRPRRRPGPLRRRGRTRAPACPARTATPPSWPCSRGRWSAASRCSAVCRGPAAAQRRARRHAACSTCPDVVGHTGHNPQPGVFGRTDIALDPGSRVAAALGRHGDRAVPPPPGDRPARRRAGGHRPGAPTARSRPWSWPGRPFVRRGAVAPRAGRSAAVRRAGGGAQGTREEEQ